MFQGWMEICWFRFSSTRLQLIARRLSRSRSADLSLLPADADEECGMCDSRERSDLRPWRRQVIRSRSWSPPRATDKALECKVAFGARQSTAPYARCGTALALVVETV
jgi:hypothetical protein